MKTKFKILVLLLLTIITTFIINKTFNNHNYQNINTLQTTKKVENIVKNDIKEELIPVSALRLHNETEHYDNKIKIQYENPNNCKIIGSNHGKISNHWFYFGGGRFTYNNVEYTITEIADEAFKVKTDQKFITAQLTIPHTIKRIGDRAFYNNSKTSPWFTDAEIEGIFFEEGLEYIGESAFEKCQNISQETIKLPNSLKKLGNRAFEDTGAVKYCFDLRALDHVIDVDCDPLSENGCLPIDHIKKILFKDEATKNLYLNNEYWKSCAQYFEVWKTREINLSATLLGAKYGSVEIDITNPEKCKILYCGRYFYATDYFDFGNGKFILNNKEYIITEIDRRVFSYCDREEMWLYINNVKPFFDKCTIKIPSSIKGIDTWAFYYCNASSSISTRSNVKILFEEGLESINDETFRGCFNNEFKATLKLPNTLKFIGERAFYETWIKELDLTALDHVINVDRRVLDYYLGCLWTASRDERYKSNALEKIYVKNEEIKAKYLANVYWRCCADIIEVKDIEVSATLLGAKSGFVKINVEDPNNCIILSVSKDFYINGNFDFNGGKFTYCSHTYTITKIDDNVFKSSNKNYSFFENCNLTIPSTIKEIGKEAFANYSNKNKLNSINFEKGIKSIDDYAFANALSSQSNHLLELPESIQHLGNDVFKNDHLKYIKINSEEVINVNKEVLDENGCFVQNNIKTIYVKTERIRNSYINSQYWRCCTFIIKIDDKPLPDECITIDAKELGAQNGTITLNVKNSNNAIIEGCSDDFYATGDFNFNDGRFVHDGKKYKISEIAAESFKLSNQDHYYFENCNLTIPLTIDEIGNNAFGNYANSNNHKIFNSINFEEGIKTIGEAAFANTLTKDSSHSLILPNTINYLDDSAFANDYINEVTLSWVDDVIKTNNDVLDKNGCFANNNISKIYVKSENVKQKYVNSDNWKSCTDIIEVKDSPIEKNIINITLTNGTTWKIDAKYIDSLWNEFTQDIVLGDITFRRNSIKAVSFSNIDSLIKVNSCFLKDCYNLESVDLSRLNNLQTIGDFFLANCPKVKNVILPESLVSIGNDFLKFNTTIEQITLNTPNLKEIGFGFLEGCPNIKIVDLSTIKNNFIEYRYNFVGDSNKLEHIFVDQSLLDKYLQNEEWSSHFKDGVITVKN